MCWREHASITRDKLFCGWPHTNLLPVPVVDGQGTHIRSLYSRSSVVVVNGIPEDLVVPSDVFILELEAVSRRTSRSVGGSGGGIQRTSGGRVTIEKRNKKHHRIYQLINQRGALSKGGCFLP